MVLLFLLQLLLFVNKSVNHIVGSKLIFHQYVAHREGNIEVLIIILEKNKAYCEVID